MDCSLPGSSVYGIFQARVLEWVAIAFSEGEQKFLQNQILAVQHGKLKPRDGQSRDQGHTACE